MICGSCLGQRGRGDIVSGWSRCEKCDGTGEVAVEPTHGFVVFQSEKCAFCGQSRSAECHRDAIEDGRRETSSFFSVIVDWISEDQQHRLVITCDRCHEETTMMLGKHGDVASATAQTLACPGVT